jgi:hypothetical protein
MASYLQKAKTKVGDLLLVGFEEQIRSVLQS